MINIYSVVDQWGVSSLRHTSEFLYIYIVFSCIYMGKFIFDQGWHCVYQSCHVVMLYMDPGGVAAVSEFLGLKKHGGHSILSS